MRLNRQVPDGLIFSRKDAAEIARVPIEKVSQDLQTGRLSGRWMSRNTALIHRDALTEWLEGLQEYEVAANVATDNEIIALLQARINELEHQIMASDPFLPTGTIKRHAKCLADPVVKPLVPKDLYFMRCEGYIKIGVSRYPSTRLKQIRSGGSMLPIGMNYKAARLLHVIPDAEDQEKELHLKFAHLRHTGEWFTETSELTAYIEGLAA